MALTQFSLTGVTGMIELATDTQAARDAAHKYWITIGIIGESLLAITCAFAWWYQRHTKQQCLGEIKRIGHARLEIRLQSSTHGNRTRYLNDG
jgi:hypothetical protein